MHIFLDNCVSLSFFNLLIIFLTIPIGIGWFGFITIPFLMAMVPANNKLYRVISFLQIIIIEQPHGGGGPVNPRDETVPQI
jgi:hypothetical protein